MEETVVNEASRTYTFPSGRTQTYYDVVSLRVSASGNHYLKHRPFPTKDTIRLAIVRGWESVDIDPGAKQDWTV